VSESSTMLPAHMTTWPMWWPAWLIARSARGTISLAPALMDMDRSHRPWTEDDIVKLRELAQKYPATTIARQLGRSVGAVSAKARALKLSLRMRRPTRKRPTPSRPAA
jgi:hypothetical protein